MQRITVWHACMGAPQNPGKHYSVLLLATNVQIVSIASYIAIAMYSKECSDITISHVRGRLEPNMPA